MIGPNDCIYDHDHKYNSSGLSDGYEIGKIIIGNNVWIGAGVLISCCSIIGENCVIGAGTILNGKVEENSLVYYEKIIIKKL